MIDRETVEKIKGAADIVEVVSDYVHLIRRGANYMGLCPFHNERTPSFSVNKSRNFCYCFSCKKGGSPVNFIMEKEGLSYHEALLHLAKKYGIEVVEREMTDEERERQSIRESMFVANEWAMRKMESDLCDTDEGREIGLSYLTERGVTDEAMKAFHLGYALDKGNELTEAAKRKGFDLNVFKKLGLVGTSQQGRDYDRFRGRVIFPIFNTAGKVIAFGGRDLKGGLAKYINSPESELYKKSNELYGLFQAKSSIVNENKCFLVEGYMDVIGMWQSGLKNVVASSGTALTEGQIAMIHRFTQNITLIYDGDAAGIKAALRGIDMLLSRKLNVKVLLLPDGHDPDSFARKNTPEEFRQYVVDNETDIIRFKAKVLLNEYGNDPQKRIEAIRSVAESIAHIPDNVARDVYVQECSHLFDIPESSVSRTVAKARAQIVTKLKQERLRKEFADQTSDSISTAENNKQEGAEESKIKLTVQDQVSSHQPLSKPTERRTTANPLYPLEKEVLKYCVRYAYLNCCTYEDEEQSKALGHTCLVSLKVIEFVKEEMQEAGLSFNEELFARMFHMLEEMFPDFNEYIEKKSRELDGTLETLRRKRYSEIAEMQLSMDEIKREEKKLESELATCRESKIRELTKEYPGRILVSDEDESIRHLTLELILEKHHLSNIYLKGGNIETEEDKLGILIVRALDEWKNELINLRIKDLVKQLQNACEVGDHSAETKLQAELNSLMTMRREMSKYIGDRTIAK